LLVVLAMIALLAVLVFTGTRAGLGKAHATTCRSNLRQIGVAMVLYAGDHEGRLPGTSHGISWTNSLAAYVGEGFIGRCPAVRQHRARITYAWNDCLANTRGEGRLISELSSPSATMVIGELATNQTSEHFHFAGIRGGPRRITPNQFRAMVNVEAHGSAANYLFADGRVEEVAWPDVQARLLSTNANFIVP
jgi:prepilin-type processing-associated H-X9-DG protein